MSVSISGGAAAAQRQVVTTVRRKAVVGVEKPTTTTTTSVEFEEDLSHRSIGGDHPSSGVKKSSAVTGVSPPPLRRPRKVTTPPLQQQQEKLLPRWASVLGKNFLLLILLLGFLQMLRNLLPNYHYSHNRNNHNHVMIGVGEIDRRIADTESLLKTTTKMMQAQVEVVDRKVRDNIAALRKELSENIEDNALTIQQGFNKIQDRTDALEKSLGELNHFMSKQDFHNFFKDHLDNNANSLDEMRASLKEMIDKEFEKHGADGLGRVDYALASGGAMIIKHSEPYAVVAKGTTSTSSFWFPSRVGGGGVSNHAYKMLRPSFGEPGQCFPLKGSAGFVQIMLRTPIIPQAFTLEHVSKRVAYDRSSAPKDCRVSGWLQDHNKDAAVEVEMFRLAEFAYDLEKSNNAQTFNALDTAASGVVNTIRLDFTSNHGSPSHTCIYRFRVHGQEPSSVSMLPMQS